MVLILRPIAFPFLWTLPVSRRLRENAFPNSGSCLTGCFGKLPLCLASDDTKTTCDATSAGLLWPEAANHDFQLRKKYSRCGELEVCTRGRWHFHWQSVTVRLDQLRGGSQFAKPAGCEVLPETVGIRFTWQPTGPLTEPRAQGSDHSSKVDEDALWGRQSCLQPPFRRLVWTVSRLKAGCSQDWLPHNMPAS